MPLELEILGQRLTVRSDEAEEHVRRVAAFVEEQVRKAAAQCSAGTLDLALIAALNIASEYWKLHAQQEELHQAIGRLTARVEAKLGPGRRAARKGDDSSDVAVDSGRE